MKDCLFFCLFIIPYTTIRSVTHFIMYVIYTDPVQRTNDFDEACFIADDYFNATGYIVAVEEDESNA